MSRVVGALVVALLCSSCSSSRVALPAHLDPSNPDGPESSPPALRSVLEPQEEEAGHGPPASGHHPSEHPGHAMPADGGMPPEHAGHAMPAAESGMPPEHAGHPIPGTDGGMSSEHAGHAMSATDGGASPEHAGHPMPATDGGTPPGHAGHSTTGTRPPPAVKKPTPKAVPVYSCPMHPEVRSDKPGRCPKCGMPLELEKPKKRGTP